MKFSVERQIIIEAPVEKVRALVEDFKHWQAWSPWIVVEPGCSVQVAGEANTPGHVMSWQGELIGSGENTLRASHAQGIDYDLAFLKPWKSKAGVSFLFEALEEHTKVTWQMHSSLPLLMFFMIKTMKNLIAMDYDRGLLMLKHIAERGELQCSTENSGVVNYSGFSYVGIQRSVAFADIPTIMSRDFEKLVQDIVIDGKKKARHWVCLYPKLNLKSMQATYIAAVSDEDIGNLHLGPEYIKGRIADTKALEIKHHGGYEFIGNAWSMGMAITRAKKLKASGPPFEQYWNSPMEVSPEALETSIYFPIK